eukprot:261530-Rhodomonas_salina.1
METMIPVYGKSGNGPGKCASLQNTVLNHGGCVQSLIRAFEVTRAVIWVSTIITEAPGLGKHTQPPARVHCRVTWKSLYWTNLPVKIMMSKVKCTGTK